jgi:hypothetical protein
MQRYAAETDLPATQKVMLMASALRGLLGELRREDYFVSNSVFILHNAFCASMLSY